MRIVFDERIGKIKNGRGAKLHLKAFIYINSHTRRW